MASLPILNRLLQKTPAAAAAAATGPISIQIVAGSYDRILHGITVTIPQSQSQSKNDKQDIQFADTFLFSAHTSAIRAAALSPPSAPVPKQKQKIILATGSTDERINLYHLSAHPPKRITVPVIPSLTSRAIVEDPQNRELGSLMHHSSAITALSFPTRGKLLSSAEDSTIAVTRTRDWSLLSTIKVPIPKAQGRPSGDTAPPGGTPSGVNGFAIHPSMKLMISVGKGEKCMRLWNLVTGKKAGVLSFERGMLNEVGEGKFSSGEGRRVVWGSHGSNGGGDDDSGEGEEFCIVFEKGALVFGMDCKPRCKVVLGSGPRMMKIHQVAYVSLEEDEDEQVLAVSTEDGRVLFYSTRKEDLETPNTEKDKEPQLPAAKLIAQLGGKEARSSTRVKDFTVLTTGSGASRTQFVVTGASDGAIKVWKLPPAKEFTAAKDGKVKQVGTLLGNYETGNRITCLAAFVMIPRPEGVEDDEDEDEGEDGNGVLDEDDESSSSSDSDSE
ncbi:WD40-repeat-containing domain protein [Xylogone sp. PMI_703]|nr:WD40-repeat-containing domain protein [Xylogone sp. PMI_703]